MSALAQFTSRVNRGDQLGRTIDFPTLNLDADRLATQLDRALVIEGVYACAVRVGENWYQGALYWGPRLVLNQRRRVLEVFVLDFNQEIYGVEVEVVVEQLVREVMDFNSFEMMQKQLKQDVQVVRQLALSRSDRR